MNIYFDETQIDNDYVIGLTYNSKLINENDIFNLGQTICNNAILRIDKSLTTQPSLVTIAENGTTNIYNVDNIQEDKSSYIYTLTDNMVNFNFRYDAQPLIEASTHIETDGTKYVTLLELVQDMCSKTNLSLITTDFIGNNKHITWYDNTITAREYIGMVAELNKSLTTEGDITIQDAINASLVGCNIEGNSYQGNQPSPGNLQEIKVVKGYNLLQNNQTSQTINGVTFTINNDKSVTLNGTSTAITDLYFVGTSSQYVDLGLSAGTYTLSGCKTGSGTTYMLYCVQNRNGDLTYITNTTTGVNISLQSGDTFRIFIRVLNGQTLNNVTIYPQLEEGTGASEYIPYNCIRINVAGKNLFNKNSTLGGWVRAFDGSVLEQYVDTYNYTPFIKVKPNTQYTLNLYNSSGLGSGGICEYSSSNATTFIKGTNETQQIITITTTANTKYIRFTVRVDSKDYVMFEEGATASEYVPYSGSTTTINLQGNFIGKIGNYKDELNIDNLGNVTLMKRIGKVVADNTNYVERGTTGTNAYYIGLDIETLTDNNAILCMSNMFQPISFANRNNGLDVTYSQNGYVKLRTANNTSINWSDTTNCKNWLDANKPIVYYVLNTPYQVNLGKINIELNEGFNNISFITELDTKNTIEYNSQEPEYTINIDDCESYNIGEYHKITRVAIENGVFNPVGDEEGTTIYINPNNVFITEQSELDNIYHILNGFEYYSLEIKKGDIDIIPTGTCIALVNENEIYKTYAQLDLDYNGGWYGRYYFITGSNKQGETFEYNGVEDNYKRLKFNMDRNNNEIQLLAEQKLNSDEYTKAEIIARVNDNTSQVQINADNIDLTGYITATDLSTSGRTTINGSNITTGTINASNVNVTHINASNISTGTINGRPISGGSISNTSYKFVGTTEAVSINDDQSGVIEGYVGNNETLSQSNRRYALVSFYNGGRFQTFDSNGTMAAYFSHQGASAVISDKRDKENIKEIDLEQSLKIINDLKPVHFNYKDTIDSEKVNHRGLIAQEVEETLSKCGIKNEVYEINKDGRYLLSYVELIPDLINCIKYLSVKVKELENKENKNG